METVLKTPSLEGRRTSLRVMTALAVTALSALAMVVFVAGPGSASARDCGPVAEGSIRDATAFTPYSSTWAQPERALPVGKLPAAAIPADLASLAVLDSLQVQYSMDLGGDGEVIYFHDRPIAEGTVTSEFLGRGGIQLERYRMDGTTFYEVLLKEFPARAQPVKVGPFAGAMTWADPEANGVRTHNVYWADGTFNYALIADRSASSLLTLARVVACR